MNVTIVDLNIILGTLLQKSISWLPHSVTCQRKWIIPKRLLWVSRNITVVNASNRSKCGHNGTKLYKKLDHLLLYVLQISKVYWTISIQDLPPDNAFQ